jgi:hypothetical protein
VKPTRQLGEKTALKIKTASACCVDIKHNENFVSFFNKMNTQQSRK